MINIRETAVESFRAVKSRASAVVANVNTTVNTTVDRVQAQAGAKRESLAAVVAQIQAVVSEKLAPMQPHVEKVRAEATQEVCKVRQAGKAVSQEARTLATGVWLRVSRYFAPEAAVAEVAPVAAATTEVAPVSEGKPAAEVTAAPGSAA